MGILLTVVILTVAFGVVVIGGLILFGLIKLQPVSKERVCVCTNIEDNEEVVTSYKRFNKFLADFRLRRNEFWNSLGQFIVIIVIITFLVILLLMDKISSEAATPIIAALGSFGLGKTITSIKNNLEPSAPQKQTEKTGTAG
jgi:hypothetical protein